MRVRLSILLVALVVLPLALTGWLGWLFWQRNLSNWTTARQAAALQNLEARERELAGLISQTATSMDAILKAAGDDMDRLRAASTRPLIRSAFLRRPNGELSLPDSKKPELYSDDDRAFLSRTALIWQRRDMLGIRQTSETEPPVQSNGGWHVWYHEDGPHWLRWHQLSDGAQAGFEIERTALLASLVGNLTPDEKSGCVRLCSASGEILFQSAEASGDMLASLPCGEPMRHWHWEFVPAANFMLAPPAGPFLLGFAATAVLVSVAGGGLFLAYRRDVREAAQRVSFVNQVSHELKTPLTNIRLYVDLARDAPPAESAGLLNVVEEETGRLSRMIHNVLTFARQEKKSLELHPAPGDLAAAVSRTVEYWKPVLEKAGVEVECHSSGDVRAIFDADGIEQILGNLLSNVEKYAGSGSKVIVTVEMDGTVEVRDDGRGISERDAKRIFDPFYRARSDLTEGVSGTGLGLSIAKALAEAQQGTLRLVATDGGAVFVLSLPLA